MSDVVKRLRDQQSKWMTPLLGNAADEIEDLRKVLSDILLHAVLHPEIPELEIVRREVLDKARMIIESDDLQASAERHRL